MWTAVSTHKGAFIQFLNQKAKILGMEKLGWQDVDAPVAMGDVKLQRFTYDEACDFVIDNFVPLVLSFRILLNMLWKIVGWRQRTDRINEQVVIVRNYRNFKNQGYYDFYGSTNDASTLAHELGHAFHSYVMKDLPSLNRNYAMNVAETASTFAETIIGNATVANAKTKEEKI